MENKISFALNEDTLVVFGSGIVVKEEVPEEKFTKLVITEGITEIGENAFIERNLKEILLLLLDFLLKFFWHLLKVKVYLYQCLEF